MSSIARAAGAILIRGRSSSSVCRDQGQPWSNKSSPPILWSMARASCRTCILSSRACPSTLASHRPLPLKPCALGPVSAGKAARAYLDRLGALAPATAARIVDKTPDNVRLVGLIAMLWTEARVIICSRDLRDVALSCWQTGFTANPWNNDWDHLGRRFADHQRILSHWRCTRPLAWLDVSYEDVVANLEENARRLVEFAGLPWDPACLNFHATRRVVRTASLVQVRQPVHPHSVGRWRRYEQSLQPLFDAFQRHGVELADYRP